MKAVMAAVWAGLACSMAVAAPSQAAVIGFEDTGGASGDLIANGYAGYAWTNFAIVNPSEDAPQGGWANGVTGAVMAFNADAATAAIESATAFDLRGGHFVGAWNEGLEITAIGYIGATRAYAKAFTVGTAAATPVRFDWGGVTRVTFASAGGVDRFYDMSGEQFGVDALDLAPTAPVPEPASWALMIVGFGALGHSLRRRPARRRASAF